MNSYKVPVSIVQKTHPRTFCLRCFSIGLTVCAASSAVAQIASDGTLPGKNKFDTVEVLTKLPNDNELRRRSLVAVKYYGREEIDRFGDATMADVLSNLPGVQMVNGAPALSGLDPKYTKILFNSDPAPAGVTMEQINPALVERVEITRGQSTNQSSQSIGGTINIVFKDPPKKNQESVRYGIAYQNERPTPFATYTIGGKTGDLSYNVPISAQEFLQTWQVNADKHYIESNGVSSVGIQERYWRYANVYLTASPTLSYEIDSDQKVTVTGYFQSASRKLLHQYARTVISGTPVLDDDFKSQTEFRSGKIDLGWTKNLTANDRLEAKLSQAGSFIGACWDTFRPDFAISAACEEKTTSASRFSGNYQRLFDGGHAVMLGFNWDANKDAVWERDTYLGVIVNPIVAAKTFRGRVDNRAIFLQDEWEVTPSFATNFGLRAESVSMETQVPVELASATNTASTVSNTTYIVNPIIHLIYRPDPGAKQAFRASVSRGFKTPDLWTLGLSPTFRAKDPTSLNTPLNPDEIGNSQIRPEVATGLDFSYEMPFASSGFINIGAFYRDVENIIAMVESLQTVYWSPNPRWVRQPINFSHGSSYGIELELRGPAAAFLPAELTPSKPINLRLNLNYYGSKIDALSSPNNRFASQYPWTATFSVDFKPSDAWSLGASYFKSPGFTRLVSTNEMFKQSDLSWVNAFAQYKIDSKSNLRIGINNLFPNTSRTENITEIADQRVSRMGRTGLTITLETRL